MRIKKIKKLFKNELRFQRNTHLIAIAPNASSSSTCPSEFEPSPSIEPYPSNIFIRRSRVGVTTVKNPILNQLILKKSDGDMDRYDKIWKVINLASGSIQNNNEFSEKEQNIFKTASEINQNDLVNCARVRQNNICQSASFNVFFDESVDWKYVLSVHWNMFSKNGVGVPLKTSYYYRTIKDKSAGNKKIDRNIPTNSECPTCEG